MGDAVPVKDIVDEYKALMDNEPDEDRKEVLQYAMYKALTDRIDKVCCWRLCHALGIGRS